VSVVYGISCNYDEKGNPRPAVQFLIDTNEKKKDALVLGCAHPCRTGKAANNLTLGEVESFNDSSVKQIVFHCLFDLVSASNKALNQVLLFKVEKGSNLCDAVKAFCTNHSTTRKALLGLINMSVSSSIATRALVNAKISAAKTGVSVVKRRSAVTTGGCKSRQNGTTRKKCNEDGCTNQVRAKGFCGNHGTCSANDCTNKVKARCLCEEHGECNEDGCTNQATAKGFCGKHGTCSANDCTTNA
jgi:hypothetical protein